MQQQQAKNSPASEGHVPFDSNIESVVYALRTRSKVGYKKYGTTTERTDIDFMGWLQHLQEELMDAVVYIERIKKERNMNV